jgi:predicted glycoside hydrolase/deacetylase ChbG (UPF0249 family)
LTGFILNADDYALTAGVSDGILALAEASRISATSAMVNMPHWRDRAAPAVALRHRIALGLHLNLTFGPPLGPMPRFAPDRELPPREIVIRRALSRSLPLAEIGAEIGRQLDRFEEIAGVPPDFVDGHHHVHVLPGIRGALIGELRRRFPAAGPLVRDSGDRFANIVRRRTATPKALTAAALAAGFGREVRASGFAANDSFAGFSTFGSLPYATEFERFLLSPGSRPMIMCHPGFADDELGARDSIAARRTEEQAFLAARPGLPELLWRPERAAGSRAFPW